MHLPLLPLSTMVLCIYIDFVASKVGLDRITARPLMN